METALQKGHPKNSRHLFSLALLRKAAASSPCTFATPFRLYIYKRFPSLWINPVPQLQRRVVRRRLEAWRRNLQMKLRTDSVSTWATAFLCEQGFKPWIQHLFISIFLTIWEQVHTKNSQHIATCIDFLRKNGRISPPCGLTLVNGLFSECVHASLSVLKRCVPKTLAFAFGPRLRSKTRCFRTRVLGRRLPNGKPQERLLFRALRSQTLAFKKALRYIFFAI